MDEKVISGLELKARFDRQYAGMGNRAILLSSTEFDITKTGREVFEKKFGISWSLAIDQGLLRNAVSTAEILELSSDQLEEAWMKSERDGFTVKLQRGCHCGLIDSVSDKPAIFCINGFFPAMREKYSASNASIWCCSVGWTDDRMPWREFLEEIIGHTNPEQASPNSLRHVIQQEWQELGLCSTPNILDNAIHASASAFEAFVERCNWCDSSWLIDPLGSRLFSLGLTPSVVQDWMKNSLVKGKSVFDHMDGLGCQECLDKCSAIFSIADGNLQ
jgi:hypothetical protein